MDNVKCSWCGKTNERNRMILERNSGVSGLMFGKYFCSNRCKTEFHNSQGGQTDDDSPGKNQSQTKTIEHERLEFEKQKYEDQKELEEKKERERKAEKLMSEGKKFQSFYVRYISSFFR